MAVHHREPARAFPNSCRRMPVPEGHAADTLSIEVQPRQERDIGHFGNSLDGELYR